jgi:hypothetical protein
VEKQRSVFPNAGHMPHKETPKLVINKTAVFIKSSNYAAFFARCFFSKSLI